jgi:hypothetical protein
MAKLFDDNRIYLPGDPQLQLIGNRAKLSQWRHKGTGPAHYKLGRKICYHGSDLNAWAEATRVDPASHRHSSPLSTHGNLENASQTSNQQSRITDPALTLPSAHRAKQVG